MALWLRMSAALLEDQGLVPAPVSDGSEPPVIPASGVPVPSPDLQGHMHSYSTHTCTKNQSINLRWGDY